MKTYLDCIPCFFRQALEISRLATEDEAKHKQILDMVAQKVQNLSLDANPPQIAYTIHEAVKKLTDQPDLYQKQKHLYNQKAMSWYPALKKEIEQADDPLLLAIRFSIMGNIIDFGPNHIFDLEKELEESRTRPFGIFDYEAFKNALDETDEILYIGDNTGEIVFDKLLVEVLKKPVVFVVRGGPVLNDATREDAVEVGLDKVATIIDNGIAAPGILLDKASPEFLEHYHKAGMIISKGMGNFETLSDEKKPIFFMLRAKCLMVARHLNVEVGDVVLKTYH